MKTATSNTKKRTAKMDLQEEMVREALIAMPHSPRIFNLQVPRGERVSLQNQLRDLFAENDMVLSLAKRLQQKLFGECEACAPVATPKTLEQWIAETARMAKEAHALLAMLNERIEAD